MTRVVAGATLAAAMALACAQPQAPPGGEPDRVPPRVIAVTPAAFDTLVDPGDPVVFEFDERISERFETVQRLEEGVLVSPATGEVRVDRGRRSIEVRIEGGWRPGLVYRVVVLPVFRDLFNNRRGDPVDLVFSTGAPIPESAVAGFAQDPITGEPVPDARVEAVAPDGLAYVAATDSSGFFALRYIPPGAYQLRAWLDQDRDDEPGFEEPHRRMELDIAPADTVLLDLALLPGDTVPPRLLTAEALDPVTVRLLFDDYFAVGPVEGEATVYALPDSTAVAAGLLLHGSRLDSLTAARQATADLLRAEADALAADTLAADTLAADSVPADSLRRDQLPPDSVRRPPAAGQGAVARRGSAGRAAAADLPSRELILVLDRPLVAGRDYAVVVTGVTNIRGIDGGGGTARFTGVDPPARDTAAAPAAEPGA